MSNRVGIEFQVGPSRKSAGENEEPRLELRYRYHTETTHSEGEVILSPHADKAEIEDAMTGIYQRVHEKPDMSRVFGRARKTRQNPASAKPVPSDTSPAMSPEEAGQAALDF